MLSAAFNDCKLVFSNLEKQERKKAPVRANCKPYNLAAFLKLPRRRGALSIPSPPVGQKMPSVVSRQTQWDCAAGQRGHVYFRSQASKLAKTGPYDEKR
jgi:hypothetical protein